jgi:hypothetical protein
MIGVAMLRRLSILGSLFLAACVPQGVGIAPINTANCYNKVPTKAEAMAWRSAQRVNTSKAYRGFINSYPRSCYIPAASAKLGAVVSKKPTVVRNVPRAKSNRLGAGRAY